MSGLSSKHFEELNKAISIKRERYNELRHEYKGDSKAQQQIDVLDGNSKFHERYDQYRNALKNNDLKKQSILARWFRIFYPPIGIVIFILIIKSLF